jgi:predicted nucleic acid-binding protein
MATFLLDSSVMVAGVCSWHEHHEVSVSEIERRWKRREMMVIAAPALIETYAVLTRLPPPHRLSPLDAKTLLESNFLMGPKLITLNEKDYRGILNDSVAQGVSGGRTYDGVIAACARKAKVTVLLTFNIRDFAVFAIPDVEIYLPDRSSSH